MNNLLLLIIIGWFTFAGCISLTTEFNYMNIRDKDDKEKLDNNIKYLFFSILFHIFISISAIVLLLKIK